MMRARFFAVFALLTVFAACSSKPAGNTASGGNADSEEAFLAQVRKEAANTPGPTQEPAAGGAPKIELQTTAYDMGVIPSDAIAVQKMKIFNRGTSPLKIGKVSTSCGCTTGEMEQSLIRAGGEANLIIRVDPKKIPGFFASKVLTISNNDPSNPNPTIDVVTHVQPEVALEPEVLDFGTVDVGQSVKASARIRQMQDAPFELTGAVLQRDPPFFKVTHTAVPEAQWGTPGKREYLVEVEVLPTAPAGSYDEYIILSTNLTRVTQLPLKFKGAVVGPYDIAPRTVAVRGVTPGTPLTGVLTLTGKQELRVLEVSNSNTSVQVSHRSGEKPNTVIFDFTVPQRPASPSLRDTWKIIFEVAGQRHEESVPVVIILTREN